jgi:hypothetical protein
MLRFILFIIALMMLGLGPMAIMGLLLLMVLLFSD